MKKSEVASRAERKLAATAAAFLTPEPPFVARTLTAAPAIGTIQIRFGIRSMQLAKNFFDSYLSGIGRLCSVWNSGPSTKLGKTPSNMVRAAMKIIGASM